MILAFYQWQQDSIYRKNNQEHKQKNCQYQKTNQLEKMFSKKNPKNVSSAKLLSILTKRNQNKRLDVKRGVYEQWPMDQKPSMFNYPTNYLKYLNEQHKQRQKQKQNKQKNKKIQSFCKKVPATFSTCTTMQFFPSSQKNTQIVSKFTSASPSQKQIQQQSQQQKSKFTPYMTPQSQQSQIINQSHNQIYEQSSCQQLNSKYDYRPKTHNFQRSNFSQDRRMIKTAKINRQVLQVQDPNTEVVTLKKSHSRPVSGVYTRPTTPKQNKNPLDLQFKQFSKSKSPTLTSCNSQKKMELFFQYPMRLKDYQTNFQAYKVMSQLIDQQMKWQSKKKRPKSSVSFRKYNIGIKA